MAIQSPSIRNCCLDDQDICIGCGRTMAEIIRWGDADDSQKHKMLKTAEKRQRDRDHSAGF